MNTVIKIGGGLLTREKETFPTTIKEIYGSGYEYIKTDILNSFVKDLADILSTEDLKVILANGAGPFGHYLVKNDCDQELVHKSVSYLNNALVNALRMHGVPACPIAPYDCCYSTGKKDVYTLWPAMKEILENKCVPVSYGDCAPKKFCKGYEVISADDIIVTAGELWAADCVIMLTDVKGVYTKNPKEPDATLIDKIKVTEEYPDDDSFIKDMKIRYGIQFSGGKKSDVTGSMPAKMRKLCNFTYWTDCVSKIVGYGVPGNTLLGAIKGNDGTTILNG